MAFCTSCGAKLEPGQICACQQAQSAKLSLNKGKGQPVMQTPVQPEMSEQTTQQASQQATQQTAQQTTQQTTQETTTQQTPQPAKANIFKDGLKDILDFFKTVIKKPFDATETFFDKANPVSSGVLWLVLMSVYVVLNFLNTIVGAVLMDNYSSNRFFYMSKYSTNFLRAMYSDGPAEDMLYHVGFGNYIQAFFFPILWMTSMTVVVFGLGLLINLIFVKGNFKQALCKIGALCGVTSFGLIVIQILAMIRTVVGVEGVNLLFTAAQSIVALFVVIQGLICINKIMPSKDKTCFAVMIGIAGLTISDYVLNLFFGFFAPYFVTLAF